MRVEIQTNQQGNGHLHATRRSGRDEAAFSLIPSFVRFLLVGGVNTVLGLAVIYLTKWSGLADVPANFVGYAVGLCVSFALNKQWTFDYRGATAPAFARFLPVIALAYVLNLLTVISAIDVLHMNGYAAQALGILPYTAFTYLASRYFAFRKND